MQPGTPRIDNSTRQRPLQKSMFLPGSQTQQSLAPPRTQLQDALTLSSLKKSSLPIHENSFSPVSPTFHYNQNHINFQRSKQVQSLNFNSNYSPQTRAHSNHEQSSSNGPVKLSSQMNSSDQNENEARNFLRNGKSFPDSQFYLEVGSLPKDQTSLINAIIENIKEKYLNQWLISLKQDFSDSINTLRLQVQAIKADINLEKSQQAILCKQMKSELAKMTDSKTSYTNPANSKIKKESQPHQWQKQLQMATERISQLQNKFGDSLNKLISELQNIASKNQKEENLKPKISSIKSSMPPIVLEYRQSFVIKKEIEQISVENDEMVFTAELYYVDKNGYLIDKDSHYLVDSKNRQIRLEEKHLSLLEEHNILQR